MLMELNGIKLIDKRAPEIGVTKSGKDWKKQTVVFETSNEKYPKSIALLIWNDNVDKFEKVPIGTILNAKIRVESREYNGRWYTDVTGEDFASVGAKAPASPAPRPAPAPPPSAPVPRQAEPEVFDDLPF